MITLFYNYYRPTDALRAAEIDACFAANAGNAGVGRMVVVAEPFVTLPEPESSRIVREETKDRPSYVDIFRIWERYCDGVCVLLNSDCFLDARDTPKLLMLKEQEFAAILRREIYGAVPPRTDWLRTLKTRRKHEGDLQDCWAFRGAVPKGLSLDFRMGVPGCDNRIAGEFHKAGYNVFNPWRDIRLYHLHRDNKRPYTEADRVAPPYYFPEASPKGKLRA